MTPHIELPPDVQTRHRREAIRLLETAAKQRRHGLTQDARHALQAARIHDGYAREFGFRLPGAQS